mgnify:CR=1 FL=1
MAGAHAMAKDLAPRVGLMTELELLADLPLAGFGDLVFGGHDIRTTTTEEAALEIGRDSGSIAPELVRRLARDFRAIDKRIINGTAQNAGKVITQMASAEVRGDRRSLRETVEDLSADIEAFRKRERCDRVIVVNLASTEARIELDKTHASLQALDRAIDRNQRSKVRPSLLYAYAAAQAGCPFIHFTPSNVTLCAALRELFEARALPYMGADGKTGETLVKSALAPMFKYRNLRVLSWLGYNLLGDRDGLVLQEGENKASKIDSKDSLLPNILGYAPQTRVAIDYVASLGDRKTAWDYIHFEGFLGHRMHMEFTWHGCDAILAAPLVLDMVRLVDLAAARGASGALTWLGCFFKSPIGVATQDLHEQWHALEAWVRSQQA